MGKIERENSREIEKIVPRIVNNKASFFKIRGIVREGLIRIKVEINHPENKVPRASRLRAFESLGFSSLVGESGEKDEFLKKQKYIIRNE